MRTFVADLHIHTCLSPCAELDMTPRRIIRRAAEAGLDMIAVSDHNSAENVETAMRLAGHEGVAVLPAMEITSSEEVHVIAVFPRASEAARMQEVVYGSLAAGDTVAKDWQVVVNEHDEVLGFNRRFLIGATTMPLKRLVEEIHGLGGLAIAAHVDRGAFSVSSQLGFVPEDLEFDAFEVIDGAAAGPALVFHPGVPRVSSSDAHRLEDIGSRRTGLEMEEPTFAELSMALRGEGGRRVHVP